MESERPSTWYEDTRSRILYTCEERYDGSMVAYVMDLQRQLEEKQAALDALRRKLDEERKERTP